MHQARTILALACVALREGKIDTAGQLFVTSMGLPDADEVITELAQTDTFDVVTASVLDSSISQVVEDIQRSMLEEHTLLAKAAIRDDEELDLELTEGYLVTAGQGVHVASDLDSDDSENDEFDMSEDLEQDEDLDIDLELEASCVSPIGLK